MGFFFSTELSPLKKTRTQRSIVKFHDATTEPIALAYLAIKTVKGHRYAYVQESYRNGNRVQTRTLAYLGAVGGGVGGEISATERARFWRVVENQKSQTQFTAKQEKVITTNTSEKTRPYSEEQKPLLSVPKTLSNYAVSTLAITKTFERHCARLEQMGVARDQMPLVSIKLGRTSKYKRNRNGSYTVTVARYRVGLLGRRINRATLWENYRRALSGAYLDALEKRKPVLYSVLKTNMYKPHARAKQLLINALRLSAIPLQGLELSLHVLVWNHVPKKRRKKTRVQNTGLLDLTSTKGWKDETVQILSQAQKIGWCGLEKRSKTARKKLQKEIAKHRAQLKSEGFWKRAHTHATGRRAKTLRKILACEKKMQAVNDQSYRASIVKELLVLW